VTPLTYPLEVLAGTLPWSLLLGLYASRGFRRSLGAYRPQAIYLGVCLGVALPTCWIPPGGLPRYFSPLFPAMAVLAGIVIQRLVEADALARLAWRLYSWLAAGALVLVGLSIVVISLLLKENALVGHLAEPPLVAIGFLLCAAALAWLICRSRAGTNSNRIHTAVIALGGFMVLSFAGLVSDSRLRRSETPAESMADIKSRLPANQQLVSYGIHTHPLFAYYYGEPFITPKPLPQAGDPFDPSEQYFCMLSFGESRPQLPFAWEEVGAFSIDRYKRPIPKVVVVVGKRKS
jgi:4-amino-4-deoxy-L-arabinose transferase-like glycosyltransferase